MGDKWPVTIECINFSVNLYDSLPNSPKYFVATGYAGSRENKTISKWNSNKVLSGSTTQQLYAYSGLTIGVVFPKDFLIEPNYNLRGIEWLALPIGAFLVMFLIWRKWGKDDVLTLQTEFYPPQA
ncbi:MAG: hypothetical protein IPJ81_19255 [Chitinophagaceae bacterium]|nr:hypothetical protein [Chitinophagaceae bacterium]